MTAALLIGVDQYDQSNFQSLPAAAQDVEALEEVLRHPNIGACRASEVITQTAPTLQQLRSAIETLCSNCQPNELVLLYFSGYGIVDDRGRLFLVCRNTDSARLEETALLITEVQACLDVCRSQNQVIILDCCFSGTFTKGMVSPVDVDTIGQQLSSNRRALLTSPWSIDYSPKYKSSNPSTYTQYLLNGLETGMPDGSATRPLNGEVSVGELYDYLRTRLEEDLPALYPRLFANGPSYDIAIAQAPYLEFRREANGLAVRGEISLVGQKILDELRYKYGIPQDIATAIKKDVLLPYQHQAQKRRQYEEIRAQLDREGALNDNTQAELQHLRQVYELEEPPYRRSTMPLMQSSLTQAPIERSAVNGNAPVESVPEDDAPVEGNGLTRFLRERRLMPTPLRESDEAQATPMPQFLRDRNVTPEMLRLALASLAVLALLGTVLWVALQPSRNSTQFASPNEVFLEGVQRSQRNDRSGAIEAYTRAISLNPENPNFYYNRGIEYAKAGERDRAIADYNEAIRYDSNFADAYFNRGNVYAARGDRDAARKDYQAAARLYKQQGFSDLQQQAQNAIQTLDRQP